MDAGTGGRDARCGPLPQSPLDTCRARRSRRLIGQISDAEAEVKAQVSQPAARKAICKALRSLSGDTWDIAKGMTGALAALALTGAITIPAVPFAIAIAAIVVARMGAAALCAEDEG